MGIFSSVPRFGVALPRPQGLAGFSPREGRLLHRNTGVKWRLEHRLRRRPFTRLHHRLLSWTDRTDMVAQAPRRDHRQQWILQVGVHGVPFVLVAQLPSKYRSKFRSIFRSTRLPLAPPSAPSCIVRTTCVTWRVLRMVSMASKDDSESEPATAYCLRPHYYDTSFARPLSQY